MGNLSNWLWMYRMYQKASRCVAYVQSWIALSPFTPRELLFLFVSTIFSTLFLNLPKMRNEIVSFCAQLTHVWVGFLIDLTVCLITITPFFATGFMIHRVYFSSRSNNEKEKFNHLFLSLEINNKRIDTLELQMESVQKLIHEDREIVNEIADDDDCEKDGFL